MPDHRRDAREYANMTRLQEIDDAVGDHIDEMMALMRGNSDESDEAIAEWDRTQGAKLGLTFADLTVMSADMTHRMAMLVRVGVLGGIDGLQVMFIMGVIRTLAALETKDSDGDS